MYRYGAEDRSGDCHEEGGRNALSRYVTDTEKEFVVTEIEVEQVTTDLLGRSQ
jgi:hypothetical protein